MGFADVILPLPLEGTFTYSLPTSFASLVQIGCRLIVPFGSKKFYSAIVVRIHDDKPSYPTKEAIELLDGKPLILPAQLSLWRWISEYYLCTIGEVYKAALPSGLKLESESSVVYADDFVPATPLTPSQQKIVSALEEAPEQTIGSLQKNTGLQNILRIVKELLEMGAVRMKEEVKRTYKPKTLTYVRITETFFAQMKQQQDAASATYQKLTPRQKQVLKEYGQMSDLTLALKMDNYQLVKDVLKADMMEQGNCSPSIFKALCDKGILEVVQKAVSRLVTDAIPQELMLHPLSTAQETARVQIVEAWQQKDVCLLHGVTGSGKTEVYIHLMKQALESGKQVLFLLPEIVLTAQLTDRLKRVFGHRLGVYHSRYPDAERVEVYNKMLSAEPYDIIVGVRSSIFLPFRRLGLVIIDEEHETSFKQAEPAPRYHARNAALVMAAAAKAKTLLGSATPSLESYYNAQRGKYGFVQLTTRYGNINLPHIEVVDMKELRHKKMMEGPFTPQLLGKVREALEHRQQVILFQNRRGFAPMMECKKCGWVPRCQCCDVSLTLHRSQRKLTCHYCGATYNIPTQCPNCQESSLIHLGYGTERIEECLQAIFPEARIARMDLDTTRSRQSYERLIDDFQHFKTDILIGTQMVTKGLDFEHVSVVGILNASSMLSMPDFRSYERAFQMMEQVAGRAGRKNAQGYVVLQTMDTKSSTIKQVVGHDYVAMYREQMQERELFNYPPFCRIVTVYLKHRDERTVEQMAIHFAQLLRQVFGQRVLGPDTPPVGQVQRLFIRKMLLKIELNAQMSEARSRLRQLQHYLMSQPQYKAAQVYYDVD